MNLSSSHYAPFGRSFIRLNDAAPPRRAAKGHGEAPLERYGPRCTRIARAISAHHVPGLPAALGCGHVDAAAVRGRDDRDVLGDISTWARIVAVVVAGLSAVVQLMLIPAQPWWSLIVIAIDVLIIYAVIAHGDELRDSRG
jgi:hypothetical protein